MSVNIAELLRYMQDGAARRSRGPSVSCSKCGESTLDSKRNLCHSCIMEQPHIKALIRKTDLLYSHGYDDIHGKPLNRTPEFFHFLREGETAERMMMEVNEGLNLRQPRDDAGIAKYGTDYKILGQYNRENKPKTGGRYKKGTKKPILIASENPAFLLPDAA